MIKKIAIVFGIVLLVIVGLVVAASLIPLDSYRGVIEDKASASLGRKVSLIGSVGLTLFPKPGVSLEQIEVDNVLGAKDAKFATVKKVKAFVAILPLLSRRVEVTSLSVDQPKLYLEKLPNGTNNWTFEIKKSEGPSTFQVAVHDLSVSQAYISYRTGTSHDEVAIDSANVEMTTLSGPFDLQAELVVLKIPLEINAKIGALDAKTPIEIHLSSDKTKLNGNVIWERPGNKVSGQFDAKIDPAIVEKIKPGTVLPKVLSEPLGVQGNVNASSDLVQLVPLTLDIKGQTIKGSADLSFKPISAKIDLNGLPGQSDFNLSAKSDANRWQGTLSANVKSLVPLLNWLDVPADAIPAKLTKDITLKTNFEVDGQTRLRELEIQVAQARLNGDATYEPQKDGQKLTFNLSTPSADALLAVAEKELANNVGEASASGYVSGNDKHLHFALKPNFAASEMSFEGDAYDLREKARLDSSINIRTSRLSALAMLAGAKLPGKIESATIAGNAKGTFDALDLDLKMQLETLSLNAKGTVSDLKKATALDLAIDANDPNFRNLMDTLELPTSVPQGRMNASLRLKGPLKNLQANAVKITVGPNFSATGDFALNREQAKSFMKAKINATALDLTEESTSSTSQQSGSAWSSKPIDFAFLNNMNADIEFNATSLKRKDIVVQNPKLSVKVSDGKVVAPLSGSIYGGGFNATATLTSGGAATIKADLKDANMQTLLPKKSDIKLVDGRLSVDADLAMQGKSVKELVSSLRGKVGFASKDGKINGFDLQAISRQISNFKDWTSVLGLLTTSLNGGQTDYKAFNGQILFERGVGTIQGMTLTAETAQAEAKGSIDLPNDSINVRADLKFTQPANLPSIGMRLEGPIDSPRRVLDTTALQTYLVRNVFTNVLENVRSGRITDVKDPVDLLNKVFGRPQAKPPGSSNPPSPPPPAQPQPQPKPNMPPQPSQQSEPKTPGKRMR